MLAFLALCILSGCNHLFYQPIENTVFTPKQYELEYEAKSIKTKDGETLALWVIKGQEPRLGTVLHFHGNGENMTTHFLYFAWLTQFGFDLVTFDYRGYGQSTGVPTREGLIVDGVTAINQLLEMRGPHFVIGQSLGGAVAVPAVARSLKQTDSNQSSVKALVIESTFASYRDLTQDKLSQFWLSWPFQWPLSYLVSDDLSPRDFADQIKIPTLVIHGNSDQIVPIEHGRSLFNLIGAEQKFFWELEGEGHTHAFVHPDSLFRPKLLSFFCDHHPTPSACKSAIVHHQKSLE